MGLFGRVVLIMGVFAAIVTVGALAARAFTRSTYHLGRKGFSLTRTNTTRRSEATINALAQRAGFNHGGFTGCTVA